MVKVQAELPEMEAAASPPASLLYSRVQIEAHSVRFEVKRTRQSASGALRQQMH